MRRVAGVALGSVTGAAIGLGIVLVRLSRFVTTRAV
jgi:hypothetical protein